MPLGFDNPSQASIAISASSASLGESWPPYCAPLPSVAELPRRYALSP